ncbi:MAG: IS21 family transposase [Mesotoga sp.]|jgi:transposase|nr:IS21 family transposase [Mesotoga sp.]
MGGKTRVISMEDWVTIRNLKKKNPDMGSRRIAKLLGISRSTVIKALASQEYPRYRRQSTVNAAIEPFKEFVSESYLVKNQKVSVIFDNLASKGFAGSRISLYRYIAEHLREQKRNGLTSSFMPYETLPGEHMLYDWSEYLIMLGPHEAKVYLHMTELGFARHAVLSASMTIRQADVFDALEDAFHELGGIASRLQVDNARVFIDDASVANFKWNDRFLEFCGFYGIHPTRSLPGHPWSKGKVERPFAYIEDHFITNNRFASFDDLYRKLKAFEEKMNDRLHSVIRQRPVDRFNKEREHLLELPKDHENKPQRFTGFREESRRVTTDCLIAYGGNRYSVPYLYAGQDVWVRVSRGAYLVAYSKTGTPIATHLLCAGKGNVVIDRQHYRGYIHRKDRESKYLAGQKLKERFLGYGRIDEFLNAVKSQKRINSAYHLTLIGHLFDYYCDADCIRCMEECFRYRCFSSAFIKGFITTQAKVAIDEPVHHRSDFGLLSTDVKRSLEEYRI